MQIQEVKISKINDCAAHELAENFHCVCCFCDKMVKVNSHNFESFQKLNKKKFYCPFCLRNNHHFRSARHILPFSYRAIIGYYYYRLYDINPHKLYFSQIEDCIKKHENIGLQNPVFSYDPNTFLWYLDFNRIGNARRKAPFQEVLKTTKMMLDCFDLKKHQSLFVEDSMQSKFDKALDLFYQKRKRPKDRKMLIPTLDKLAGLEKNDFFEKTRNFVRSNLILR
jgi:hypothetical protein